MVKRLLDRAGAALVAALGAALAAALVWSGPAVAAGGKGSMEIGLAAHYLWPGMDAANFEPNPGYGLMYHYWLNDTSSVFAGFEQMSFTVPLETSEGDDDFLFNTGFLFGGFRYRPELDLAARPYLEIGLGYQSWTTAQVPGYLNTRAGGSMGYLAGAGFEYDILNALTLGVSGRYFYLAMDEKIESEAVLQPGGGYEVTKDQLDSVGFGAAGIELTWRFR